MTTRSLKARVSNLENNRTVGSANRVLTYDPAKPGSKAAALNVGKPGKFMLVSSYATDADWEVALRQQQRELQTLS